MREDPRHIRHYVRTGDLAYYDTLTSGLVPVKILTVSEDGESVILRATAARRGIAKGALLAVPGERVRARTSIIVRHGGYRVRGLTTVLPFNRDADNGRNRDRRAVVLTVRDVTHGRDVSGHSVPVARGWDSVVNAMHGADREARRLERIAREDGYVRRMRVDVRDG